MTEGILIAVLSLLGTLGGSYFANKKSSALIAYRLEELEKKIHKHNAVIERTYSLEESQAVLEEKIKVAIHRIDDLEKKAGAAAGARRSASFQKSSFPPWGRLRSS